MPRILENYAPLFDPKRHKFLANTPRLSAKSTHMGILQAHLLGHVCASCPRDIVVFRANANSLSTSVMQDTIEQLDAIGLPYEQRQAPWRLDTPNGTIYYVGVSGHDQSRVRGFHPKRPLIAIIGDECQQIGYEGNLKHALATFRRFLDVDAPYKEILCGNPHEVKGHWWNVYNAQQAHRNTVLRATWKDLAVNGLITPDIIEEIEAERELNPTMYRIMYEGDISELVGGAYPSFHREEHLITPTEAGEMFKGERIELVIFGGDGAIMRDATAIVPIAVLSSGRAVTLEMFCHFPDRNHPLPPSELAANIGRYVDDLERKYRFEADGVIPCVWVIDCAAEDLITQLRYTISPYHDIKAYTTKNILRNNSAVNNVFARGMLYIQDFGGLVDYTTGRFVKGENILAQQLEAVVWKNNRYDPAIPNDVSDALTYGASYYYENPDNLYYATWRNKR